MSTQERQEAAKSGRKPPRVRGSRPECQEAALVNTCFCLCYTAATEKGCCSVDKIEGPGSCSAVGPPGRGQEHEGKRQRHRCREVPGRFMDVRNKPTYRFDEIEVDASRSCVTRNGQSYYLRQQTFQVLLYLLKNHQRVVGKDELVEQIWDDTAVTDNALVQCITTIRKTLGDDSRHPRFIRTIPKVGYRFIGPIEEHFYEGPSNSHSQDAEGLTKSVIELLRGVHHRISRRRQRAAMIFGAALVLIAGSWFVMRKQGGIPSYATLHPVPGKKAIAVVYFDNQAGDARSDWLREGLADMLITDLAQSDQLTVLSRQQLHSILERTGYARASRVSLDEALKVAQHSH